MPFCGSDIRDQIVDERRIGLATRQRIEPAKCVVRGNFSTAIKIQNALEQAGIAFTDDGAGGIGVRLQTNIS